MELFPYLHAFIILTGKASLVPSYTIHC